MNLHKKVKVLVIGPWISGHIQNWLGNDSEFDIRGVTFHPKPIANNLYTIKSCFFINRFFSMLLFPFFLILNFVYYKPNVIHVHFLSSYGLLSLFLPGKKIVSIWGSDFNKSMMKNNFRKKLYTFVLNHYDVVNSPSLNISKEIIKCGVNKSKTLTLQYGVDAKNLSLINRKHDGDIFEKKIISSIRNWDDLYQVKELIKAWEEISPTDYKLRIFGKSSNADVIKSINNIVSNCSSDIEIVGFIQGDEFYQLLKESTAFISIPIMDGTPLSVLECMALKLIPIVSNIPANKEWVVTSDSMYLDVPIDKKQLSSAIDNISTFDKSILDINLEKVIADADVDNNREEMFSVYRNLIC